ncbi:uncharacterized protein YlxW (UPF0749 family) [Caldalkalibacillus uzonensis]|uniref:Uncharacterized protein YlxW (UPF0749 family) n=1 Tax=Caldalkalibacillus uzonensis TaxID=353224 RepID=A0ABU0CTJ1_9BACI|nr:DUF881 domain-containing protein [Caldalkalibacillus uzonensis]MDQ0339226.1 uncharacterized protein YlxW (UPF0749 family) [Caldalkalibacillus uzonensis]
MNQDRKVILTFTFVCFILGLMLAVQYASTALPEERETRGLNDLRLELQKERERTQALISEIGSYHELLHRYDKSLDQDQDPLEIMEKERLRLRQMIGLEEVQGEGFIIRIEQRELDPLEEYEFDPFIYDEDLRLIVNELNAYGAQAIAINGERIIATSAIRNVQNQILINTRPVAPPYEIKVIGDPSTLIPALRLAGLEEYFDIVSHNVSFEEKERLTVPAYAQRIDFQYLQPVKEDNR